jgi:hypothetical protein
MESICNIRSICQILAEISQSESLIGLQHVFLQISTKRSFILLNENAIQYGAKLYLFICSKKKTVSCDAEQRDIP